MAAQWAVSSTLHTSCTIPQCPHTLTCRAHTQTWLGLVLRAHRSDSVATWDRDLAWEEPPCESIGREQTQPPHSTGLGLVPRFVNLEAQAEPATQAPALAVQGHGSPVEVAPATESLPHVAPWR